MHGRKGGREGEREGERKEGRKEEHKKKGSIGYKGKKKRKACMHE